MTRFLLFVVIVVGSAVLASIWPSGLDQRTLEWQRLWRRAYASFDVPLPGTPDLTSLDQRLAAQHFKLGAPVLVRIFKQEFELELWLMRDGRFLKFATYPICRWSGDLGPKLRTGDRQAPEGFYAVTANALNPNSRWHRSFNLGFPNAFDRAHDRTGSFIMVHGGCSSVGCFAMTNPVVDEIWRLITAALDNGQKSFQVQVFPFRMEGRNLERHASHPDALFWNDLKAGSDLFEATQLPPRVSVCERRYRFKAGQASDPSNAATTASCDDRAPVKDEARPSG